MRRFRAALALPVAFVAAAAMLVISELAYHGADGALIRRVAAVNARKDLLSLRQRVTEAESAQRGYLLVGDREYLTRYHAAHGRVAANVRAVRAFFDALGDEAARTLAADIDGLVGNKLFELSEVLALYDRGERDAALLLLKTNTGRDLMEQLHDDVLRAGERIDLELADALRGVQRALWLSRAGVAAMTLASLALLVAFMRQLRALQHQREVRQAEIRAERDRLETEVGRRTSDLTELARHLQTAREDERARLARELHDELGALLTAAKFDVARIRPRIHETLPDLQPRLQHLIETLDSGIALKRRIIEDLRPSTLDSLGLCPALEILCSEFAERTGLTVHCAIEPAALSAEAELTVFRVVQESLTNVARSARAANVHVTLRETQGTVLVEVRDDGAGFDAAQVRRGRHGLAGMRFRVEAQRGRFELRSAPGQGTTVRAQLPVEDVAAGDGTTIAPGD